MPDQAPHFYVTTPIYYVNARPHLGHAYTTLVADTLARRHRLLGHDVFFLTGTDEHGQKIERSATAAGVPPQQFTDLVSDTFRRLWHRMGITYTGSPAERALPNPLPTPAVHRPEAGFIRTTDPDHKRGVQHLFRQLQANGFIYKGTYTGQYCVSDEAYVEGPPGIHCPDCGRLTETVSEENYYFRLSAFQRPLLDLIESNTLHIRPDSARNEVLSFLRGNYDDFCRAKFNSIYDHVDAKAANAIEVAEREGYVKRTESTKDFPSGTLYVPGALKDLSISRTSFHWGVPVPNDEKHVIYVWLDALVNYMTALGYGSEDTTVLDTFWPADLHLVGKEITRFHCIYWPAFLLALNPELPFPREAAATSSATTRDTPSTAATSTTEAGAPHLDFEMWASSPSHQTWAAQWLPKQIVANGWLLFDNSKMSKSKGNVVRAETILTAFGEIYLQGIRDHNTRELKKDPTFPPVPDPTKAEQDLFATDVLRYFLLREIPFGQDGSFSFEAMVTRYNADLANGYGNLVSRTLSMVEQYGDFLAPDPGFFERFFRQFQETSAFEKTRLDLVNQLDELTLAFAKDALSHSSQFEPTDLSRQLEGILLSVQQIDRLLSATAPWIKLRNLTAHGRVIDSDALFATALQSLHKILYTAAESIRILTALLYPILPFATARVWAQLGLGSIEAAAARGDLRDLQWSGLKPGTKLGPLAPIFPRAPKGLPQTMADLESTPPPNLLDVANDEHDATSNPDHTAFREAPLADVAAGTTDQTAIAEARSESPAQSPGAPFMAQSHRDMSGNAGTPDTPPSRLSSGTPVPAEPTGLLASTDPAAGPRTPSNGNPIAQVAGSFATTTATPAPTSPTHVSAEPSGIFATPASATPVSASPADETLQITIDDFAKIDLRVAEILVAERIPKADKLLRLEVDLGPLGRRQILSGIAEWYPPETLVGRRIVVIANLAPRKMRGLESHGMLLAASEGDNGKPILATFAEGIAPGTRLK